MLLLLLRRGPHSCWRHRWRIRLRLLLQGRGRRAHHAAAGLAELARPCWGEGGLCLGVHTRLRGPGCSWCWAAARRCCCCRRLGPSRRLSGLGGALPLCRALGSALFAAAAACLPPRLLPLVSLLRLLRQVRLELQRVLQSSSGEEVRWSVGAMAVPNVQGLTPSSSCSLLIRAPVKGGFQAAPTGEWHFQTVALTAPGADATTTITSPGAACQWGGREGCGLAGSGTPPPAAVAADRAGCTPQPCCADPCSPQRTSLCLKKGPRLVM